MFFNINETPRKITLLKHERSIDQLRSTENKLRFSKAFKTIKGPDHVNNLGVNRSVNGEIAYYSTCNSQMKRNCSIIRVPIDFFNTKPDLALRAPLNRVFPRTQSRQFCFSFLSWRIAEGWSIYSERKLIRVVLRLYLNEF